MDDHKKIIVTFPNFLTLLRFVFVVMAYFFGRDEQWAIVLALVGLAAISDYFDGDFARRYKCKSVYGAKADPIADKTFVVVLLLLFNINLALIVLALEAIGMFFSNRVRKDKGGYYIGFGSKGITFAQMLFVIILILNKIPSLVFFNDYEQKIIGALFMCSLIRVFIYGDIYFTEKRNRKKLENKKGIKP